MNLEKFAKLMARTTSPNDNEALVSVRKANALLLEANLTWDEFISQKTIIIQEIVSQIPQSASNPQQSQQSTGSTGKKYTNTEIEQMLVDCLLYVSNPSGKTFIASLNENYRTKGYLSQNQARALHNWWINI